MKQFLQFHMSIFKGKQIHIHGFEGQDLLALFK